MGHTHLAHVLECDDCHYCETECYICRYEKTAKKQATASVASENGQHQLHVPDQPSGAAPTFGQLHRYKNFMSKHLLNTRCPENHVISWRCVLGLSCGSHLFMTSQCCVAQDVFLLASCDMQL